MASFFYNSAKAEIVGGVQDLDTDTFKIMLLTASYAPDIDAHVTRDDLTDEIVGAGYTAGGQALSGVSLTVDNSNNRAIWDATDPAWTTATITDARYAVIYQSNGGAASGDPLTLLIDFLADYSSIAEDFIIQLTSAGIATVTD
jgi:hypothetical protein